VGTAALGTPNKVAVMVRDAPAKREPTICLLRKSDKSTILQYFLRTVIKHNLQSTGTGTTQCKQIKEYQKIFTTNFLSVQPTEIFLFLYYLVFLFFCPPPAYNGPK
jgi:hypothetical protein